MSLAKLVLLAWIPVVIYMFVLLKPRRAVLAAFILGWLFLPVAISGEPLSAHFKFKGFPNLDKATVTSLTVLFAVIVVDRARLMNFRPHWLDLPVLLLLIAPLASSLYNAAPDNELGLYDGLSESFRQFIVWGLPYLIGRVYFNDLEGMRELAIGVFLGGLIYIPVCWWEIRMSPTLHGDIYGYFPATFRMQKRYGGYRPMGFMPGGLSVGMWMTVAALTGVWIWASRAIRKLEGIPIGFLVVPLFLTALFSKATGAALLLLAGTVILFTTKYLRTALPLLAMMVLIVGYMGVRSYGEWSGEAVVDIVEQVLDEERAQSLAFRFHNEDLLSARALEQPVFGWGGWNRSRVLDDNGEDISTTDGLWIIVLGQNGMFGLSALTTTLLVPALALMWFIPAKRWKEPRIAIAAVFATSLVLHMADNLLNGFPNPVFMMMNGGVVGLLAWRRHLLDVSAPYAIAAQPAELPRPRRRAGQRSPARPTRCGTVRPMTTQGEMS